ncbi:serine hydrolase domain-containing protein [Microbaculum sp. FT89]|uniref:serine hydrolase domain-containing protein n=1 Tax=Microbaculum sp. FT89 TaxID=3447298 RepID=UPI003F52A307
MIARLLKTTALGQAAVAGALLTTIASGTPAEAGRAAVTPRQLQQALDRLVIRPDGPPGAIVVVRRGGKRQVFTAGTATVCAVRGGLPCRTYRRPRAGDAMRIASVSKTFSGAAALALVTDGALSLDDTIGTVLPDLPAGWHPVTLRNLLNHTSGLPDFAKSPNFGPTISASPHRAPPPRVLLSFVEDQRLAFAPGTAYAYSNSDNIVVGLMVEKAAGKPYAKVLKQRVYRPLKLKRTELKNRAAMPRPYMHGYSIEDDGSYDDVSTDIAFGGYAWASGGIVASPSDLSKYVGAYVGGDLFGKQARKAQFRFRGGDTSSPPGPGRNAAGLALFRYKTRCGSVYGHTGSILGYTQLIAASRDGRRSVTFSINTQAAASLIPALRRSQVKAVCLALGK